MSKLELLKKSLLTMDADELREKIRFIREDRRVSKMADKAPAKKRQEKAKTASKLIAGLTPEQKLALLKELGGK